MKMSSKQKTQWSNHLIWIHRVFEPAVLLSYMLLILLWPERVFLIRKVFILLMLSILSLQDAVSSKISIRTIVFILCAHILYDLRHPPDLLFLIIAALISAFFLVLYLLKREAIGLGDVMMIGVTVLALEAEGILIFLFLTFFLASVWGILAGIRYKGIRNRKIPLAPCITAAFFIGNFIL